MALSDKEIKAYSLFRECVSREKDEDLIIRDMMSKKDYLAWLVYFTHERKSFSDESLLYLEKDDPNRDYLKHFDLFYKGVEKYARDNYIYPDHAEYGYFYRIKYNEYGFEIGTLMTQGIEYFCKRVPIKDNDNFIDFKDILVNKKQDYVDEMNSSLMYLSDMVRNLYTSGIPIEAITDTLKNTISDINYKDCKKKIRK